MTDEELRAIRMWAIERVKSDSGMEMDYGIAVADALVAWVQTGIWAPPSRSLYRPTHMPMDKVTTAEACPRASWMDAHTAWMNA